MHNVKKTRSRRGDFFKALSRRLYSRIVRFSQHVFALRDIAKPKVACGQYIYISISSDFCHTDPVTEGRRGQVLHRGEMGRQVCLPKATIKVL